jgi:hypothetical protein
LPIFLVFNVSRTSVTTINPHPPRKNEADWDAFPAAVPAIAEAEIPSVNIKRFKFRFMIISVSFWCESVSADSRLQIALRPKQAF